MPATHNGSWDGEPTAGWQAGDMMHDLPESVVSALPDPLPSDLHVLDVREPAEWVTGHIEGAQLIPLMQLVERYAEIPTDAPLLVVCRVGSRSAQATAFLYPYLADRSAWPYAADIAHFEAWPARQPSLLLAGYRLGRSDYVGLWRRLPPDPEDLEVRRNMAVTQPLLWVQRP